MGLKQNLPVDPLRNSSRTKGPRAGHVPSVPVWRKKGVPCQPSFSSRGIPRRSRRLTRSRSNVCYLTWYRSRTEVPYLILEDYSVGSPVGLESLLRTQNKRWLEAPLSAPGTQEMKEEPRERSRAEACLGQVAGTFDPAPLHLRWHSRPGRVSGICPQRPSEGACRMDRPAHNGTMKWGL